MDEGDSDRLTQRRGTAPPDPARWPHPTHGAAWGSLLPDDKPTATRAGRQGAPWGRRGHAQRLPRSGADASRRVPKMPKPLRETQVRTPGITIAGTLLILALTVLAFAGGRLFGRVTEPTPTAQTAVQTPAATAPQQQAQAVVVPTAPAPQTPAPLPATFARAPIVCLDPGHGGADRGFTRVDANGTLAMEEEPLDLAQAWELRARLEQRSYRVVMTRETDAAVNIDGKDVNGDGRTAAHDRPGSERNKDLDELQARINICNAAQADLLVSIHVNGYSDSTPRGYETWFTRERPFGDRNAAFATLAYAHLKEQLRTIGYVLPAEEERGVLPDTTADVRREYPLFKHFIMTGPEVPGVVTPSAMPGAIVEALFISNDGDAAVLASPEGQQAIVTAYENAIAEYFERYPPEARLSATPSGTPVPNQTRPTP
jgi:N-acetylmuramoyl-L-alanine amidase